MYVQSIDENHNKADRWFTKLELNLAHDNN